MYVIDLFSGSGGSAKGFEDAGFTIKGFVEINESAKNSFKHNYPKAIEAKPGDITQLKGPILNKFLKQLNSDKDKTIILACPPCQGFSSARRNNQRTTDTRNELIFEFVRLVKEIQPIAFVMENVPGLAKGVGKPLFEKTIRELKKIGYKNTWYDILEVADYGVPERRKRLVLMGTRDNSIVLSKPAPTNKNPTKTNIDLPIWKTVRDQISDLSPINPGEKNSKDKLHQSAGLKNINLERLKFTPHNGGSRTSWPNHLILECHKKLPTGHTDVYGRMRWDTPSPTITGGCAMISKGRYGHPEQNRAISLREAARLQTFPDSFIFEGNFGEVAKQIGNAVPPLFAQRLAESLLASIKNAKINKKVNSTYQKQKAIRYFGSSV
jgi:DNA (cytosine-5)-methyltransferase 1